jgi:demethylmenaquinone methyltransferase/2-methoxy-6-polyprenyl-1,4-benzoquinol methylase
MKATRAAENMKGLRRGYYNLFSRVYDGFIRLHSGDTEDLLRRFIVEKVKLAKGERTLDLCTGTGSVALELARAVREGGIAVGLDFSRGMLKRAQEKSRKLNSRNLHLVEGDASMLPFKDSCFKAVTCSHAFYELKGSDRKRAVNEVARVTREGGKFCLMEHAEPEGRVAKLFFNLRIRLLGSADAGHFFEEESDTLRGYFQRITTEMAPTGKSKLMCGVRKAHYENPG